MFENPTWIDVINFLFCYIGAQTVIKGIVDFIYSNIEHKKEIKRINEKYGGLDEETEKKIFKRKEKRNNEFNRLDMYNNNSCSIYK